MESLGGVSSLSLVYGIDELAAAILSANKNQRLAVAKGQSTHASDDYYVIAAIDGRFRRALEACKWVVQNGASRKPC